jgi:hypothetical protein
MVNMNMKWKTFWIQGFLIIKSNILFISNGYDMNEHSWEPIKNLSNSMEKVHAFHQRYQTSLGPFFVELVARREGDVMDVNVMEFIPLNAHP